MRKLASIVALLALGVPAVCAGQGVLGPTRLEVDRAELTRLLGEYEAVLQSSAYSDVLRGEVRERAEAIRVRLKEGDLRPGDRIALFIEREAAVQWDTLVIEPGPQIDVPTLGVISLRGVLRSELESHLTGEIGRFIQSPEVKAHALIRVSMTGVRQPGFYTVEADLQLSDAITVAGGPGALSSPGRIRIERGQDILWDVDDLVVPVAGGMTLDDLGLQAGDRIVLPPESEPSGLAQALMNSSGVVFSVLLTALIR